MDKRRLLLIGLELLACLAVVIAVVTCQMNDYTKIDEWSSALTAEKFDWAEASRGYGVEKESYSLTEEDFETLAELLHDVTEKNCTRKYPKDSERIDYRLSFSYDGKLWLLHCLSNGMIDINFEDLETAAYYGCEDSQLYLYSPNLYNYILDTIDNKAE